MVARQVDPVDDGDEGGLVGLCQQELVMAFSLLLWIEEVVVTQLPPREAIHRLGVSHRVNQGSDQQRNGRQALLAIDHQHRRLARYLVQSLLDVDDGANKMSRDV